MLSQPLHVSLHVLYDLVLLGQLSFDVSFVEYNFYFAGRGNVVDISRLFKEGFCRKLFTVYGT